VLKQLNLLSVYDSSEHNLVTDLQVPLLLNSIDYLRGVGFFTSGWLRIASEGLTGFVQRGGRARIVLSPILEEGDWRALQQGEAARFDARLKAILELRVNDLAVSLSRDTLNAMAWMVADGVLDIRFAVPRDAQALGSYHDKVAVFRDELGDAVALHGSLNDSVRGSLNGEAFSVFTSWQSGQEPYLKQHMVRLEALWRGDNSQFRMCLLPEAIRERIVALRSSSDRPYSLPADDKAIVAPALVCPVTLRPYQDSAVNAWLDAGGRGMFEMATGTGKTFTALAAAVRKHQEIGKLALIVLVPYLHLLEQWEQVCRSFGFRPILCSGEHGKWQIPVQSSIRDFGLGVSSNLCIIAVHKTATTDRFHQAIRHLKSEETMLIGDEAHGLGAPHLRCALVEGVDLRLGMSATPRRWFDEKGTESIFSYFGPTCFEMSLTEAIDGGHLAPYRYHPHLVNLSDDELEEYSALTARVAVLVGSDELIRSDDEALKKLLLRRAAIVSSATDKIPAMLALLRAHIDTELQNDREVGGILVYCAPGSHRDVLEAVAGTGLRCHEFVHTVSLSKRQELLNQFATGDIQALIAIRCLDEGVDVPATKVAFVLASSTNPREFVQRRGRILRLSTGKTEAIVHDFIVVPTEAQARTKDSIGASLLRREMPRFVEFASSSLNEFEARGAVRDLVDRYEMLHLFDMKPWDVYNSLKGWDWETDD
jgi:superfamily II DNA or RNA helicase